MDEELEQPNKISPESFFEQLTAVRETADAAQKTSNSNLNLLNSLKTQVDVISTDFKLFKDEKADEAFEEEDRKQKELMDQRAKAQGEKKGEGSSSESGEPEEQEKGLLGSIGDFISNFFGGLVGGVAGLAISGVGTLLNFGSSAVQGAKDLGKDIAERLKGTGDDIKEKGKNILGGIKKTFSGIGDRIKNFDGRPGSRKTKKKEEKLKLYNDYIKEGAEIMEIGGGDFHITYKDGSTSTLTSVGMGGEGDSLEERFNDHIKQKDKFQKEQAEKFKESDEKFGSKKKKKNIFGFNQGGEVDSVPAMLTPGEFVVTKDAVEKVGADTLKGLNASVGATNKPSFLGSIGTDDEGNFEKFMKFGDKTESELTSSDGSFTMKNVTDMSGGGLDETTTTSYNKTFTEEDGTVTTLEEEQIMRERISSIGYHDLIEHKDQLLGEIHKLKGFESVTIDQVINGTTGIPQEKLLDILLKSDAQKATSEKEDKAYKEDLKARGIKPGQGFNISANDEVGRSLAGTMGYRMGQINPDTLVTSTTSFLEKTKSTFKTDVKPKSDPFLSDLSASINASVKGYNQGGLVGSSITPTLESGDMMSAIENLSQSVAAANQNIQILSTQNQIENRSNNQPQTTVPSTPPQVSPAELKNTMAPIPAINILKMGSEKYLSISGNSVMVAS